MLDLKKSERNRIVIFVENVGERKGIYYTNPTTSQMVRYNRDMLQKKKNKIVFDPGINYLKSVNFGAEIATGFDEFNLSVNADGSYSPIYGDFAFGYDGQPISSDPASPNFREDWKDLLAETAHNLLAQVARIAFTGVKAETTEEEITFEEFEEKALPLAKS